MSSFEERSQALIDGLNDCAPDHVIYVPCSTMARVIDHFEGKTGILTFPVTREEEGGGIAAGLSLGGARPVLVIQDNGLGNSLTALTTFPQAYHIPILLLVARRGGLNEFNSMIHHFCEHADAIMTAAQLRFFALDGKVALADWRPTVAQAYAFAQTTHRPVALFANLMGG